MSWNFSTFGHGKGEHDGASVEVKRALTNEQSKFDGATLKMQETWCSFYKRQCLSQTIMVQGENATQEECFGR